MIALVALLLCAALAQTVQQAAASSCATSAVAGLTSQLVRVLEEMSPGVFTDFEGTDGLNMAEGAEHHLQTAAVTTLRAVQRARNRPMQITSALRTLPQQVLLYQWFRTRRCNIKIASRPGSSNHQAGAAVDVADAPAWRPFFARNGWRWLGRKDPVHFDFLAGDASQKTKAIEAFQRLFNRNNPQRTIALTGVYDAATERAVLSSPASGFPIATLGVSAPVAIVNTIAPRMPVFAQRQDVAPVDNAQPVAPRVDVAPPMLGSPSSDSASSLDSASTANAAPSVNSAPIAGAAFSANVAPSTSVLATASAAPSSAVNPQLVGSAVVTPLSFVEPRNRLFSSANRFYAACDAKYRGCQSWLCRKAVIDATKRGRPC
jgi:hypothetical protein